ncbi:hypothetical protein [Gracilibacillus salinarum]|uniref:Uncharacterized protein n=1 Tax=Gracilibacillus salinarum TaxID=2932255 RepID=A0ABY4GKJ9_9BACI|nr:hypothetical protein [Gracilibacillus salinarum]UOQ84723.1 hypothetical protein MUN87_19015 [Gracilibacillus salinarum]
MSYELFDETYDLDQALHQLTELEDLFRKGIIPLDIENILTLMISFEPLVAFITADT